MRRELGKVLRTGVVTLLLVMVAGLATSSARTFGETGRSATTFTQNMGQWPDSILFRANVKGAAVWLTRDGIYYQLTRRAEAHDSDNPRLAGVETQALGATLTDLDEERATVEVKLIKAAFVGASPEVEIRAEGLTDYRCNYFLGDDPGKWRTDVPNYESVTLHHIYEGIDLRYSGNPDGKLTYQYSIAPNADVREVQVTYDGLTGPAVEQSGMLVGLTEFGEIRGILASPAADAGKVTSEVLLSSKDGTGSPEATGRLMSTESQPLTLVYGTLFGGSGGDIAFGLVVDSLGFAYVTGSTESQDFPTQDGFADNSAGGVDDAFLTKFYPPGGSRVFSTYIGGWAGESGHDIALDDSGYIYLTGVTNSRNFPVVNGLPTSILSSFDAFLAVLTPSGDSLTYSTHLGGLDPDFGRSIAVDDSGYVYLTGQTASSDFPIEKALDDSYGGAIDVFVTKLSPAEHKLVYSTFLGGEEADVGNDIAVDHAGCAYITGWTRSPDFPTQNAYDDSHNGEGYEDAIVAKISPDGSALIYSTFLGGASRDQAASIAVDMFGRAVVAGQTYSGDFPVKDAFDSTYGGSGDGFLSFFSQGGDSLYYSTFVGGSVNEDHVRAIALDRDGCLYATGYTWSSDFPLKDALDSECVNCDRGWGPDAFLTKFTYTGGPLVFSTLVGGSNVDYGNAIAIDNAGSIYLTGDTYSPDFPLKDGYDMSRNGGLDGFIVKFSQSGPMPSCCGQFTGGLTGNTDCDVEGVIGLADISRLVDHVYLSKSDLCCPANGNVDGDANGRVDLSDVIRLVDHVYLSKAPTSACQ